VRFNSYKSFFRSFEFEGLGRIVILNIVYSACYFFPKSFGNVGTSNYTANPFEKGSVFAFCNPILVGGITGGELSNDAIGGIV